MDSRELRQAFLDFFVSKQHTIVDSGSLVPDNDPTLLFTNAGMVQFKEALAFRENRGYTILEDSRIGCVKPMTGCGKSKAITFWWVNSNANGASATVC